MRTASGDVKLGSVRRKLQVKTASGDVVVGVIEAEGTVNTVSGDIGVERVDGSLVARAVSGDARIATVRGPLTLSTTSGDARIESVEAGEVHFQTVSGDVRIGVGRGTRVWIDATSVSGDLESELGLADQEPADEEQTEPDAAPAAVVPLQIKTVSGDVSIVRAAASVFRLAAAHGRDDLVLAPVGEQVGESCRVPGETERRGQELVQAGLVEAGLARRGGDAGDAAPRLPGLELPGRVEPFVDPGSRTAISSPARRIASIFSGSTASRSASQVPRRQSA